MEVILNDGCMGKTNNGRYNIVVADGTHEFQRLLMYSEDLIDNSLADFKIELVMFHVLLMDWSKTWHNNRKR